MTARDLWRRLEPIHDVVYFSPESRTAADAIGMRGYWMGYVAFRVAPLGPVGPAPVIAAFHGFPPSTITRALPDAWSYATPELALEARAAGTAEALRRLWGSDVDVTEAADLAWTAAQAADDPGRVLGAANRALQRPDDPVRALWQAATTLREHRGDGHVAVLVTRGIGPVHAHLLKLAAGGTDPDMLRRSRRWSDEQWAAAGADLRERGWTDDDGRLTDAGTAERDEIERLTDAAAVVPWEALGRERSERLAGLLDPLAAAVAGDLPAGNPVGLG
ncbi:SCO6745 family protein [Pseudonocardia endophytica]|uniref:SalK n=1 Tax=Pseudonocardia endophytica TaxID=401976 RepID=A0A4R1HYL2_PSEEN|nr:hypothetical protein [Pseudonocardia endophytica]TCK25960.1 hypothetical protein EV378_1787 [Pseudonocardia endophytica]